MTVTDWRRLICNTLLWRGQLLQSIWFVESRTLSVSCFGTFIHIRHKFVAVLAAFDLAVSGCVGMAQRLGKPIQQSCVNSKFCRTSTGTYQVGAGFVGAPDHIHTNHDFQQPKLREVRSRVYRPEGSWPICFLPGVSRSFYLSKAHGGAWLVGWMAGVVQPTCWFPKSIKHGCWPNLQDVQSHYQKVLGYVQAVQSGEDKWLYYHRQYSSVQLGKPCIWEHQPSIIVVFQTTCSVVVVWSVFVWSLRSNWAKHGKRKHTEQRKDGKLVRHILTQYIYI